MSPRYVEVNDPSGRCLASGVRAHKYAHIIEVEKVLGHALPAGAEVHHVDGDRINNAHSNLVACQDRAYHMLLHRRQAALQACGNPDWRKCSICHKWDAPANVKFYATSRSGRHLMCPARKGARATA